MGSDQWHLAQNHHYFEFFLNQVWKQYDVTKPRLLKSHDLASLLQAPNL